MIVNNNKIITFLLGEEEDKMYTPIVISKKNQQAIFLQLDQMNDVLKYLTYKWRHLNNSKPKFREFFPLNYNQLLFIPSLIKYHITLSPSKRINRPIKPEVKLYIHYKLQKK